MEALYVPASLTPEIDAALLVDAAEVTLLDEDFLLSIVQSLMTLRDSFREVREQVVPHFMDAEMIWYPWLYDAAEAAVRACQSAEAVRMAEMGGGEIIANDGDDWDPYNDDGDDGGDDEGGDDDDGDDQ